MGAFDNMDPDFASRLQAFLAAANDAGFNIQPGSGYRSYEEQAKLYADYKAGKPGQARAAAPGKSQHNHGLAMDLDYSNGDRAAMVAWAHANASRFGLYFPMDDEDWHIQPLGGKATDKARPTSYREQLSAAGIDPRDEMSNRMFSIMNMLVGDPGNYIEPELDNLTMSDIAPNMSEEERLAGKRAKVAADAAARGQDPGVARNYAGAGGDQTARILATIRQLESSNRYGVKNPNSSASGAYQFVDGTWNGYKGYRRAADAPPSVQDEFATQHVQNILRQHGGDVSLVPVIWYLGHVPQGDEWDRVPRGNSLSPRQYQQKWMAQFGSM
jgi:muramidase (phage lysozyme)